MKVSTRGDYACRALLSLTLHPEEAPTAVRDIAERTALPQPYLEQILLALKGAGLVRSKRGVGGGYVLARDPADITLAQMVSAVDGPIVVGDFGEPHQNGACDHEGQCVLLAVWADAGRQMRTLLEARTLADVAAITRGQGAWPEPDLTAAGPRPVPHARGHQGPARLRVEEVHGPGVDPHLLVVLLLGLAGHVEAGHQLGLLGRGADADRLQVLGQVLQLGGGRPPPPRSGRTARSRATRSRRARR